ncbi:MAG TPA: acyl--CoA ligase [Bacillales bacterium]|nr:acyl--CoA ligase [Bacillales bacterium]
MEKHAADPARQALIWKNESGEEKTVTYAKLFERANQMANGLKNRGLKKGDRVLIMLPRITEAYTAYLACLKAGLVVIPSSEMLRAKDLSYRLNHSSASAVIVFAPLIEEFERIGQVPSLSLKVVVGGRNKGWLPVNELTDGESHVFEAADTSRDDMAFLSYTSGTTGQPKGVVHTHGWAYAHLRTAAEKWMNVSEGDRVWATAGPGWAKWVWSPFLSTLGSGAVGFVYYGKFDPETYLALADEYRIQVLCCTPTEYRLMAKVDDLQRFKLTDLKSAVSAGEPLNREVIDTFRNVFGIQVRDGYGQTENTLLVCNREGMKIKPGSMGKPTPGNRVEIITEEGDAADVGEVGDIAVHKDTPALFKEYYKDPERTNRAFRGNYYLTGDKAKKDKDGYFWFEGRSDDIIISSGYTIGPFEVEDALVKHPDVKECAVVASPDPVRGHIVKAYVVLKNNKDSEDPEIVAKLQDHVKKMTAPYKYPRQITFVNELPKTTSGKIRRVELRQMEKDA